MLKYAWWFGAPHVHYYQEGSKVDLCGKHAVVGKNGETYASVTIGNKDESGKPLCANCVIAAQQIQVSPIEERTYKLTIFTNKGSNTVTKTGSELEAELAAVAAPWKDGKPQDGITQGKVIIEIEPEEEQENKTDLTVTLVEGIQKVLDITKKELSGTTQKKA